MSRDDGHDLVDDFVVGVVFPYSEGHRGVVFIRGVMHLNAGDIPAITDDCTEQFGFFQSECYKHGRIIRTGGNQPRSCHTGDES